jgi:hemerythrin
MHFQDHVKKTGSLNNVGSPAGSLIDEKIMPQVAMEFMQLEHDEILTRLKDFKILVTQQPDGQSIKTEIELALEGIFKHTQSHFLHEEKNMKKYHYLPFNAHKAEHDQFLSGLMAARNEWINTQDLSALKLYLFVQVPAWFMQHLNSMDLVTARFIATQRSG